jgi:hypothetical protein
MLFYKNRARGVPTGNFMEIDQNPHNPHYRIKDTSANFLQLVCLRASPSVWACLTLYKRNIGGLTMTTFLTAGGRIACKQCEGTSRRTKERCKAPAAKNKSRCRFHGGRKFSGPKTSEGRLRCAAAKTIHGCETREARIERSIGSARFAVLESIGFAIGLLKGTRTRGRRPDRMSEAYPELQAMFQKMVIERAKHSA